jgi:hypothetical protein
MNERIPSPTGDEQPTDRIELPDTEVWTPVSEDIVFAPDGTPYQKDDAERGYSASNTHYTDGYPQKSGYPQQETTSPAAGIAGFVAATGSLAFAANQIAHTDTFARGIEFAQEIPTSSTALALGSAALLVVSTRKGIQNYRKKKRNQHPAV